MFIVKQCTLVRDYLPLQDMGTGDGFIFYIKNKTTDFADYFVLNSDESFYFTSLIPRNPEVIIVPQTEYENTAFSTIVFKVII